MPGGYASISTSFVSRPSNSAAQDAWWCVLNGKYQGMRKMGPNKLIKPDILVANAGPLVMIKNKGLVQNTSLGANVKSIETIEGMEIDQPDDDATSATVYMLASPVFKIISVKPRSEFFKLREVTNPGGDHVHEGDTALVIRTPDFQLVKNPGLDINRRAAKVGAIRFELSF